MAGTDVLLPTQSSDALPQVRTVTIGDLMDVLRKGIADFRAMPTHAVFICAIYPIVGLVLFRTMFAYDLIPILYPLAAGFALLGPIAAIGLYEYSRRIELGMDTWWSHAFDVVHSPSLGPIVALAATLLALFAGWLIVANEMYYATFGDETLTSPTAFLQQVLTTAKGQWLIIAGNAIGFVFALVAASISVISLPLLLDRNIGYAGAIATSLRVVAKNPVTMAVWFLIVACGLLIGSLLLFVPLVVILPVLGHATWHLYRKAVEPDPSPRPEYRPREVKGERYGADFPVSLFTRYEKRDKP